jgi:hypothetical protein
LRWQLSPETAMTDVQVQTPPKKIILIGHSHTFAILRAAELQSEVEITGPMLWADSRHYGYDPTTDSLKPQVIEDIAGGPVFSALGGFAHALLGLVQHPEPFDFILPDAPDMPLIDGAYLVPYAVARDVVAEHLASYHRYMELVRQATDEAMYHLAAPPVLRDDETVLADVPWGRPNFPKSGNVSPASLRWKLWHLANGLTRQFSEANDIRFIECPRSAMDEEGYLRPEYYSEAFHGNANYGALVIDQIKAFI